MGFTPLILLVFLSLVHLSIFEKMDAPVPDFGQSRYVLKNVRTDQHRLSTSVFFRETEIQPQKNQ